MTPGLQALSAKIDALTTGLQEAQNLLAELTEAAQEDPKQKLIDQISQLLPKLSPEQLNSVEDYVAFLAQAGPGGGENQASTQDGGGPGGGENQASTRDGGP